MSLFWALVLAGVACFAAFCLGWAKGHSRGMYYGGVLLAKVHTEMFEQVCRNGDMAEMAAVRRFLVACRDEVIKRYGEKT